MWHLVSCKSYKAMCYTVAHMISQTELSCDGNAHLFIRSRAFHWYPLGLSYRIRIARMVIIHKRSIIIFTSSLSDNDHPCYPSLLGLFLRISVKRPGISSMAVWKDGRTFQLIIVLRQMVTVFKGHYHLRLLLNLISEYDWLS